MSEYSLEKMGHLHIELLVVINNFYSLLKIALNIDFRTAFFALIKWDVFYECSKFMLSYYRLHHKIRLDSAGSNKLKCDSAGK